MCSLLPWYTEFSVYLTYFSSWAKLLLKGTCWNLKLCMRFYSPITKNLFRVPPGKKAKSILVKLDVIFELFFTLNSKTKLSPIVPKQHDIVRNHNKLYFRCDFVEIYRRLPRKDVVFAFRGYGNKSLKFVFT
jgi:hypothetical protein